MSGKRKRTPEESSILRADILEALGQGNSFEQISDLTALTVYGVKYHIRMIHRHYRTKSPWEIMYRAFNDGTIKIKPNNQENDTT